MKSATRIVPLRSEKGVVITLVAVFVLFVLGAMAAMSIDVVTLYTARSEAQLAADAAALAGARVLANSGMTSQSGSGLVAAAQARAATIATQVAQHNLIGGDPPTSVTPTFGANNNNPTIHVIVTRTGLPMFFARIWGTTQITVGANATAEAYNPSWASTVTPVAPICVKPWLLPNKDPSNSGNTIFDPFSGTPNVASNLLGWSSLTSGVQMSSVCGPTGNCLGPPAAAVWKYYPGDDTDFPHPTLSVSTCSSIGVPSDYQNSIMGCIQTPISCNSTAHIDVGTDATRDAETADAVDCLTHSTNNLGDTIVTNNPPTVPFDFVAGAENPAAVANPTLAGQTILVSDSLVTVPVFDTATLMPPSNSVTIIGFLQLFLNPDGKPTLPATAINTTVINLAGCGTNATGAPLIVGNGTSPVAVRLVSQ